MDHHDAFNMKQFDEIFDDCGGGDVDRAIRLRLKEMCWAENGSASPMAPSNRCICWRYVFGIISLPKKENWATELSSSTHKYASLKKDIFPSITNVGFDPLSDDNPETVSYYERVEKVKIIELDLNRLYMTGIEDEYFHTKRRKNMLLSVLLIWSVLHPVTSYRQGKVSYLRLAAQ